MSEPQDQVEGIEVGESFAGPFLSPPATCGSGKLWQVAVPSTPKKLKDPRPKAQRAEKFFGYPSYGT